VTVVKLGEHIGARVPSMTSPSTTPRAPRPAPPG
jgi:hypothetical protein